MVLFGLGLFDSVLIVLLELQCFLIWVLRFLFMSCSVRVCIALVFAWFCRLNVMFEYGWFGFLLFAFVLVLV